MITAGQADQRQSGRGGTFESMERLVVPGLKIVPVSTQETAGGGDKEDVCKLGGKNGGKKRSL